MKKKSLAVALCAALLLNSTACFLGGDTATERFARGNQSIQIILQEADKALNELLDLNLISPDAVIAATKWGMAINKAQEPIIVEALRYVQVKDGREVLVIDEVGRDRLLRLINSFQTVSQQIVTTVNWPGLSSEARTRLTAILSAVIPIAANLATLAYKFKTVKSPPATLRGLLPKAEISACVNCLVIELPVGTQAGMLDLQSQITQMAQSEARLRNKINLRAQGVLKGN